MAPHVRTPLLKAKNDLLLWGWRSPGRHVALTFLMVCGTTLLIFLGLVAGSWLGGWIGDVAAALGMLIGGLSGLAVGARMANAVGVSFGDRCGL